LLEHVDDLRHCVLCACSDVVKYIAKTSSITLPQAIAGAFLVHDVRQ
jgi:hypothetical protein